MGMLDLGFYQACGWSLIISDRPGSRQRLPQLGNVYSSCWPQRAGQNYFEHLATQAQNCVCHIGSTEAVSGPCLRSNSIALPVRCRARVRAAITSRRAQPKRTEQS
jgi:hypothetical protein